MIPYKNELTEISWFYFKVILLYNNISVTFAISMEKKFLFHSALYQKTYATAFVLICILIIMHILSEVIMLGTGGMLIEYIRNKKRLYNMCRD